MEAQPREFEGIHFFFDLYKNDVAIDSVDERPISEIPLPKPTVINGVECRTIAQYLRSQYRKHPHIGELDESQPGLKGGDYTYPPQFLYRTVPLQEVPDNILNDLTFFMDWHPRPLRDSQRPAVLRWEKTMDYFLRYNFQYVDVGPITLKMRGPMKFPITSHFEKPKLRAGSAEPIKAEQITKELSRGIYQSPKIDRAYMFSVMEPGLNKVFYEAIVDYAKSAYNVVFPAQAIPLEKDLVKMRN
jgi:hypothetical protein